MVALSEAKLGEVVQNFAREANIDHTEKLTTAVRGLDGLMDAHANDNVAGRLDAIATYVQHAPDSGINADNLGLLLRKLDLAQEQSPKIAR